MSIEDTLRRELEEAFRNRAHLYRLLLDELEAEVGPTRAEALLARVLERRGAEVASALFKDVPPDPVAIGDCFLAVSPDEGHMYPHDAERGANHMTIRVNRCRPVWLMANGRSDCSRNVRHCERSSSAERTAVPTLPSTAR